MQRGKCYCAEVLKRVKAEVQWLRDSATGHIEVLKFVKTEVIFFRGGGG